MDIEAETPVLTRVATLSDALRELPVSVGDSVRIVSNSHTEESGIAGLTGEITGVNSRLAVTGSGDLERSEVVTSVIVKLAGHDQVRAMSRNQVELIIVEAGAVVSKGDKSWIRTENGEWEEVPSDRYWPRADTHQPPCE